MPSSFQYGDTTPQGWDPGVYRRQAGLGHGISLKHGARPPEADEVAPRGTPAWRAALNRMHEWISKQFLTGATLGDMGFTPEHERGKQHFLRLSKGEYGGFRPGWFEGAKGHGRAYIDPYTGQMRMIGGSGGLAGQPLQLPSGSPGAPPTTGMTSGGPATAPSSPSVTPFAPAAPTVAPSPSYASPGYGSSGAYSQFPRGGKKRFFAMRG